MMLTVKEVAEIRRILGRIESADARGMKRYFATNQIRNIRLILNRAERRERNTIFNQK